MSPGDPPSPCHPAAAGAAGGDSAAPPHPRAPDLTSLPGQPGDNQNGESYRCRDTARPSLLCQLALLGPALICARQLHPSRGTLGFSLSDLSTSKPSWLVFSAGTLRRQRRQAFSSELEAVKRTAAWCRTKRHGEVWSRGSERPSALPKVPQLSRSRSGLLTPVRLTPEDGPFLQTPQTLATNK